MDEQQAIVLLKNGNLDGLEELVKRYQQQAVRAALLITADRCQAEDIVQSAFIRAAGRIDQFDSTRPFAPWFLRCVVNDSLKVAQRNKKFLALDDQEGEEAVLNLLDPAPLPEEQLESIELRRSVWSALQRLPPRQRAAVVMRYYLGLGEAEMSKELNGPAGTVKWLLFAARERLAYLLAPFQPLDNKSVGSVQEKDSSERGGQK